MGEFSFPRLIVSQAERSGKGNGNEGAGSDLTAPALLRRQAKDTPRTSVPDFMSLAVTLQAIAQDMIAMAGRFINYYLLSSLSSQPIAGTAGTAAVTESLWRQRIS